MKTKNVNQKIRTIKRRKMYIGGDENDIQRKKPNASLLLVQTNYAHLKHIVVATKSIPYKVHWNGIMYIVRASDDMQNSIRKPIHITTCVSEYFIEMKKTKKKCSNVRWKFQLCFSFVRFLFIRHCDFLHFMMGFVEQRFQKYSHKRRMWTTKIDNIEPLDAKRQSP